ncbi:Modification methylase DpnIIB [Anaerohalosphaera lusitana]|uniref:Methyltransferase n=1 Tax=Anaerohalosphaera lusitana TaxID=1936003 RepID=A0A1U9NJ20_9BACT|nr:DNA modification methylase [Anaerohalosphaera lusitana]AQT67929.1 Modification methylase DpnIIB [Anaerohalosphaera lusitana]
MRITQRNTDSIRPYENNPRLNDEAVDAVAQSLKEFGFRQPIVVDEDGVIICGHTRFKAAQKLGLEKVPVHVAKDLSPEQVKAYRIADNRTGELSEWDWGQLKIELGDLQEAEFDLGMLAFDEEELNKLLDGDSEAVVEGLTDPDAVPEPPEEPITKRGDIWLLGDHRLMCGDSTSRVDVERLMDGCLADMVFSDPPYGVNYVGGTAEQMTIDNDNLSEADYISFMDAFFTRFRESIQETASLYICHASSWQLETELAMRQAGFEVRNQIIWAKNCGAFGFGRYKFQHEPIFYAHIKGESDKWYGDKTQTTLWQEKKPAANRLHPTMKPVEIVQRALVNSSKRSDLVLDLFMGSGTTLIAAETLGRRCVGMELDPAYCDVIVKRYEEFTGTKAKRSNEKTPAVAGVED